MFLDQHREVDRLSERSLGRRKLEGVSLGASLLEVELRLVRVVLALRILLQGGVIAIRGTYRVVVADLTQVAQNLVRRAPFGRPRT